MKKITLIVALIMLFASCTSSSRKVTVADTDLPEIFDEGYGYSAGIEIDNSSLALGNGVPTGERASRMSFDESPSFRRSYYKPVLANNRYEDMSDFFRN